MLPKYQKEVLTMFDPQNKEFDPMDDTRELFPQEETVTPQQESPRVEDVFAPQQQISPQQAAGGSYYSPRSGCPAGGGYIPPTGSGGGNNHGGDEPPKKKSHKGLKAIAVFASVAFIAYASIQCYQFATENESVRSFLGKQSAEISEQDSDSESSADDEDVRTQPSVSDRETDSGAAEPMSFIELAARENAMSIPDIVDKVTPATVGVASTFLYEGTSYSGWGFGFGMPQQYEQEMPATGTGIIMSNNGNGSYYIITNAHVIYDSSQYQMGLAKEVQVVLNSDYYSGETQLAATIIGYDVAEDIAVLKVTTNQTLAVADFGSSDDLRVGELVIAIGNPLGFELFGSVTTGIISALDREMTINDSTMRLIQTDTAINSGNSGGPLINSYGQVIGINSSKISSSYSSGSASVEGLCFAIPISHAKAVINDLINYGYVTGKPLIGISGTDVTQEVSQAYGLPIGVYVRGVEEGSSADLAGIQVGDVIIAINGETVADYDELNAAKDNYKAGDTITVTVTRNGQDLDIQLVLQEKIPTDMN